MVHGSIGHSVGEGKPIKLCVCTVCVKTVNGEFPAYRELLKFNELRVISTTDSSAPASTMSFIINMLYVS